MVASATNWIARLSGSSDFEALILSGTLPGETLTNY